MSESADYDRSPWKGKIDNFDSARAAYRKHADRSYADVSRVVSDAKGSVEVGDFVPDHVETDAAVPVVIVSDLTGSMGEWPGVMFSKLPYLDNELQEYYGDDYAVSFAGVDDVTCCPIPFQARKFCKGTDMKKELEAIQHTRLGGGTMEESYDIPAMYYLMNCEMPNAIQPLMVFIGDEGLYENINPTDAEHWARHKMDKRMSIKTLFEKLKTRYSVYLIRKPYGSYASNDLDPNNRRIREQWVELLGEDHVVDLPDPSRVVDVLFGIFAKETGKVDYFEKELKDRQLKDKDGKHKVDVVLKSLKTLHTTPALGKDPSMKKLPAPGRSVTRRTKGDTSSKASKSLLD